MKLFSTLLFLAVLATSISANSKAPLIVNGEVAKEGQFPWQVGVVSVKSNKRIYCGGAIISEEWVLTAAHCIYHVDDIVVIYDTLNLQDADSKVNAQKNYLVHEEYDPNTLRNDIGLIYLQSSLVLEGNVSAVPLSEDDLKPGTTVTVSGWGSTGDNDNETYNVLRFINVTTIDNEKCAEAYGSLIDDRVVCTAPGDPLKNPCRGDAGDPVVTYDGSRPVLVAVFSFLSGLGCERSDFPAGYTRVSFYRDWIRNLTGV